MELDLNVLTGAQLDHILSQRNTGLQYVRELVLSYDKWANTEQTEQPHAAAKKVLDLLPVDKLWLFSWNSSLNISYDNLIRLYTRQKSMEFLEAGTPDKDVQDVIRDIPDLCTVFKSIRSLVMDPRDQKGLDHYAMLLTHSPDIERLHLQCNINEIQIPGEGLSSSPSSITDHLISTLFQHKIPFGSQAPLTLRTITLVNVVLGDRLGARWHLLVDFCSVEELRLCTCPGTGALLSKLCETTNLPRKLKCLEIQDNEYETSEYLDRFMGLVTGVERLLLHLTVLKLPSVPGIIRHSETLKLLSVHGIPKDPYKKELIYDMGSFAKICQQCNHLEEISVAFPPTQFGDFTKFLVTEGLPDLVTINSTTWPVALRVLASSHTPFYKKFLHRKAKEIFLQNIACAVQRKRTSKLQIIAFGKSDNENSAQQMIFMHKKQCGTTLVSRSSRAFKATGAIEGVLGFPIIVD